MEKEIPGIVLSSKQANKPAMNTGLAINIEIVSSMSSLPERLWGKYVDSMAIITGTTIQTIYY